MRKFEKISFEQFKKDICDDREMYEEYSLPKRMSKNAAAYDFFAIYDYSLMPGEIKKVPTGIKAIFESDEALILADRSSMGFKHNVRMCNQIGVIDSDYYNNPSNEGHMWIRIQNEGDVPYIVKKGDGMIQGMFIKYLTVDDEEEVTGERTSDK
jgi:dUTP pyrophosphatase